MREKTLVTLLIMIGVLVIGSAAYAGSEDMDTSKRKIYQNNTTESMRDVYIRRESEDKAYKDKLLLNSNESVKLLKEIRNLLKQLNAKK